MAAPNILTTRGSSRKEAASHSFKQAEVQTDVLKVLKANNPNGKWWIKEDGCDLKECLQESKRGEWFGDVDLGDGKVEQLRSEYLCRLKEAKDLHKSDNNKQIIKDLERDQAFLITNLENAGHKYQKALESKTSSNQKLMELNWEVVEFTTLLQQCGNFIREIECLNSASSSDKPVFQTNLKIRWHTSEMCIVNTDSLEQHMLWCLWPVM